MTMQEHALTKPRHAKAHGVHYTPPELAAFLASVTAEHVEDSGGAISVLDPACGDGALLFAFAEAVSRDMRHRLSIVGYEMDASAIARAAARLQQIDVCDVKLVNQDFLDVATPSQQQLRLFNAACSDRPPKFDVVIANPPYVRTQVLGAKKSQFLSQQFGLTGRVDLYQAFVRAIAEVLEKNGTLGLLTSNRFLTVRSGLAIRRLLAQSFSLRCVCDLGDTKLFSAAVLPVILVASKKKNRDSVTCHFDRVYEDRTLSLPSQRRVDSILTALRDREFEGPVETPCGTFCIERGFLANASDDDVWTLTTRDYQLWIDTVNRHQQYSFEDVGHIRVGIKTTADEVFIRNSWLDIPPTKQPEKELIRPLIRHVDAARWRWSEKAHQTVLYPHTTVAGKRRAVDLREFPHAALYLDSHRERLCRRRYLIDNGRQWYEIWVPHNPNDWSRPKLVFPDISEHPRFFLDLSGAIVNGDCYWITLRKRFEPDWLMLMLAVANSSLITKYYDIAFHNKLYSGRRRFMTQYVKRFPLPNINGNAAQRAIQCVSRLVESQSTDAALEAEIDELIWVAFGLVKEVAR